MAEVYEIRLSPKLFEVAETMIAMAEEYQVVTLGYGLMEVQDRIVFILMVGDKRRDIKDLREHPLVALGALGIIQYQERNEQSGNIFLTKAAFDLMAYRRKNRFMRWLYRVFQSGKDVILIIVAALTFALTVLQVLQLLGVSLLIHP